VKKYPVEDVVATAIKELERLGIVVAESKISARPGKKIRATPWIVIKGYLDQDRLLGETAKGSQ
jgi:hypothetical protein